MLCPSEPSWYSAEHVLTFSHFMSATVLPLHLLGAWLIFTKTPESMSGVKWTILNLHLCNLWFDMLMNIFIIPCPLFPVAGSFFLGVFGDLGVKATIQAWIITVSLSFDCVATLLAFENRFFLLIARDSAWKSARVVWKIANFIFVFVYMIPIMLQFPDQDVARGLFFDSLPCVPEFLLHSEIVIGTNNTTLYISSALLFCSVVFGQIAFFISKITAHLSNDLRANNQSTCTRRLQKNFLKALILHSCIILVALILPWSIGMYLVLRNQFDIGLNYVAVILASFHGFVSTSSMILIHHPYRKALTCCRKKRTVQTEIMFTRQMEVSSVFF